MKNRLRYKIAGQLVEIHSDCKDKLSKRIPGFETIEEASDNSEKIINLLKKFNEGISDGSFINEKESLIHTFDLNRDYCKFSKMGSKYYFTIEQSEGKNSLEFEREIASPKIKCKFIPDPKLDLSEFYGYNKIKDSGILMDFEGLPKYFSTINSSVVVHNNKAIMFLSDSEEVKDIHVKLWINHIPSSKLLNDCNPLLSIDSDKPFVYGAPWTGKGRRNASERYPLVAIVRLKQHYRNFIELLGKLESVGAIYPSFHAAYLKDGFLEEYICSIISSTILTIPVYMFRCLANKDAVETVLETIKPHLEK